MRQSTFRAGRWPLLAGFGVVSFAAVTLGIVVCASAGVPAGSWLRNGAAWLAGCLAAVAVASWMRPSATSLWLAAAPLGLLATLASADQDGVRRWVDLGPLHINVAMLLTPAAVAALATIGSDRPWPWLAAFAALVALVLEPDASQAAALGAPMALIAMRSAFPMTTRAALAGGAGLLGVLAAFRPDPLRPVPEVEGMVGLAYEISPGLVVLAVLLLATFAAVPALLTHSGGGRFRLAGRSLSLCFLIWVLAPALGAFPVPLVGVGMSPILGAWLGVGVLVALRADVTENSFDAARGGREAGPLHRSKQA